MRTWCTTNACPKDRTVTYSRKKAPQIAQLAMVAACSQASEVDLCSTMMTGTASNAAIGTGISNRRLASAAFRLSSSAMTQHSACPPRSPVRADRHDRAPWVNRASRSDPERHHTGEPGRVRAPFGSVAGRYFSAQLSEWHCCQGRSLRSGSGRAGRFVLRPAPGGGSTDLRRTRRH